MPSIAMDVESTHQAVELGFVEPFDEVYAGDPFDMPHKIGGQPIWLKEPLNAASIVCPSCSEPMSFLLQFYTLQDTADYAIHRLLYIFLCGQGSCHSKANCIKAFRSHLQDNYGSASGDAVRLTRSKPVLCQVCGLEGSKKCGKCQSVHYCSKAHQVHDWVQGMHSERCSASNPLSSESINNAKWSILFPESEIVTEEEPVGKEAPGTGLSPDQLAAFMETSDMTDTGLSQEELEDEAETQVDVDAAFLAFQKRISLEPEQVLRVYPRDSVETEDHPLWLSDLGKPSSKDIPSCPHCQSPRTCEVQIMPQILTHLELDHTASNALDFGSLFVYSCSNKDCVPDLAFVEECVWKQDFSLDGMGDSQRKAAAMECNEAPEL